jgi:hypothetical protein
VSQTYIGPPVTRGFVGEVYVGRKFRTVFSSEEPSTFPGVPDLAACGKRFHARGLAEANAGTLAMRYGGRMVIAAGGSTLGALDRDQFVEVVDYDPINHVVVAIGQMEPSSETPMCWMAMRHRPEIHALVHVHAPAPPEGATIPSDLAVTEHEAPYGTLALAESLLRGLRDAPNVYLADHGYVSTDQTLVGAERRLMRHLAAFFPDRFADDPYARPEVPGGNGR